MSLQNPELTSSLKLRIKQIVRLLQSIEFFGTCNSCVMHTLSHGYHYYSIIQCYTKAFKDDKQSLLTTRPWSEKMLICNISWTTRQYWGSSRSRTVACKWKGTHQTAKQNSHSFFFSLNRGVQRLFTFQFHAHRVGKQWFWHQLLSPSAPEHTASWKDTVLWLFYICVVSFYFNFCFPPASKKPINLSTVR